MWFHQSGLASDLRLIHLMHGQFKQKKSVLDNFGKPALTAVGKSNPWWVLLEEAVYSAGGELEKPEIFPASTDARYFRQQGLPAIGFSPMVNTPVLLHDHNEVQVLSSFHFLV